MRFSLELAHTAVSNADDETWREYGPSAGSARLHPSRVSHRDVHLGNNHAYDERLRRIVAKANVA
jgi:hypothetical protein